MSRPTCFDQFIGQAAPVLQLKTLAAAALLRDESPDHILLAGPPGLGKTTLAQLMSGALGADFVDKPGPALRTRADLVDVLTNLEPHSVLFIDEIHRVPILVVESFYSALEDGYLSLSRGTSGGRPDLRLDLPAFTCIGATTQPGMLSAPLRSRFGALVELDYYEPADLATIAGNEAVRLELELGGGSADLLGEAGRGTPRLVLRLVRRLRDFCAVRSIAADVRAVGGLYRELGISRLGLTRLDRAILKCIMDHFNGGPAGINAIAATLNTDLNALQEVNEPHLLRCNLLARTPRGRVVTQDGAAYLKELRHEFAC